MATQVTLNDILALFRQPDPSIAVTKFLELWPESKAVLQHYQQRPGCATCRADLLDVFHQDLGRTTALASSLYDGAKVELDVAPAVAKRGSRNPFHMAGQVREIDDSPAAYAALIQEVRDQNGRYQGLSVAPLANGRVRVYFF